MAYLLAIKNLAIIHTSPLLARIPLHSSMIPDTRKIVHAFNSVMMYHIYVYRYIIYYILILIYIYNTHTHTIICYTYRYVPQFAKHHPKFHSSCILHGHRRQPLGRSWPKPCRPWATRRSWRCGVRPKLPGLGSGKNGGELEEKWKKDG